MRDTKISASQEIPQIYSQTNPQTPLKFKQMASKQYSDIYTKFTARKKNVEIAYGPIRVLNHKQIEQKHKNELMRIRQNVFKKF